MSGIGSLNVESGPKASVGGAGVAVAFGSEVSGSGARAATESWATANVLSCEPRLGYTCPGSSAGTRPGDSGSSSSGSRGSSGSEPVGGGTSSIRVSAATPGIDAANSATAKPITTPARRA